MELVLLTTAFVVGAIAGIALIKIQGKASDGKIEAAEIIDAITEAEATFNEFCYTIKSVINNPAVNDAETVKFISEAIEAVETVKSLKK